MSTAKETWIHEVKALLGSLAGQDLGGSDAKLSFLDLGFDSLFLTQAASALKNRFGVRITFRQLLEDLTSVEDIAAYLEKAGIPLPPSTAVSQPPTSVVGGSSSAASVAAPSPEADNRVPAVGAVAGFSDSVPSVSSQPTSSVPVPFVPGVSSLTSTVLERVMKEQLRVMEQQLALLRGSTPRLPVVAQAATAPPAPPPAPPAPVASPAPASAGGAAPPQHGPFRPLEKGVKGGLSPQQQAHLEAFIPRYVARTPKSKAYTQQHRPHFADPRAVAGFKQNWKEMVYPIVSVRSSGASLWDVDGNRWVDVTMGFGVALLGHSPAFITEAVRRQLDLGVEIGPQSPLAGEVAQLICEFTGMERVTFCNTGSEAVMAALRICRTVTGRTRVVVFAGAYHGTFDEVLVKGAWAQGQPRTLPIAPGVAPNLISEMVVLEYGAQASLDWIRQHVHELAAVLVETVQSRHPDLQPAAFLQEVRRLTELAETPLIFDEVITGFRCHPGGAQSHFGIRADLATYGKIIGGGMPFGFLAGKAKYMDAFDGGMWHYGDDSFPPAGVTFFAGTFVRHPLAMAAARAMLLHLKERGPELQAELARRTDRLIGGLNAYFDRHQVPLHLEHFTSIWYPHFGPEVKYASLLYYHLREKGLHIWEGRPCFLSTAHTAEDEGFIERAFKISVAEMQLGGFLPGTSDPEYLALAETGRAPGPAVPQGATSGTPGEATAVAATPQPANPGQAEQTTCPLTEGQLEMWLAAAMNPGASAANNASLVVELRGALDRSALRRALTAVVARHQGLRATIDPDESLIRVAPAAEAALVVHDWADMPSERRDVERERLLEEESRRVFDLVHGPLHAFQLVRLGAEHHLLILSVQMIVCDGWGCNVVLEELSALYSAEVEKRTAQLPPAIPLATAGTRLREHLESEEGRAAEAYWTAQYATVPAPLGLPTQQPRGPVRSFEGDRLNLRLPAQVHQELRAAAKRLGTTPFVLLYSAYLAWLHRLSGDVDLVVGVPTAAQAPLGLDRYVGQCVHTLAVRSSVDPKQSFATLLRDTRSRLLTAQEHWCMAYGSLLRRLDWKSDPSRPSLVSVLFNLDPPFTKVRFTGCAVSIRSAPRAFILQDLGFNLVDEGDTLLVECDFNRRLFDRELLSHWLANFRTLLDAVMRDPDQPIGRLPLFDEASLRQQLLEWNATDERLPESSVVSDLLAAQAARTPDRLAVEDLSRQLTYAELDRRANQLARLLQSLGVAPNDLVGLCVERNVDLVVALVAVLKAGGGYLPIDPALPPERIALLLKDAGASVVLAHATLLHKLPQNETRIVCVDEDAAVIARESPEPLVTPAGPDDLAYGIYTSGSSGRPKCVEISRRSLLNLLHSMRREPGLRADDVMLGLAPLCFDIATMEVLLPLMVGARLTLVPREVAVNPERLAQILEERGVTVTQATPATWRMLIASGWEGRAGLKALCGGEALTPDLAEALLPRCAELWNVYGPTETTIWSSAARIEPGQPITIGKPIANTRFYIVDDLLQLVPLGVPGELVIGGIGVARRYRGQPELTAERFVCDPWMPGANARLYRTGDLARRKPDGRIELVGRKDFQLKIRGCRIEPGEIESVLLRQPGVREVVVVATGSSTEGLSLVAYVGAHFAGNAARQTEADRGIVEQWKQGLRAHLPEYMVPAGFVVLDRLPLNANGKVDRGALPPPPASVTGPSCAKVLPRNVTEERLARVWAETLKLERVGVTESFFDLGGQSLLAVTLFERISKEFGRKLPLALLFKAPTIEQLALAIDGKRGGPERGWPSIVPIQPEGKHRPLFLVHGAGGNVLLYRALAAHLAPDYPLYGLQSQGLDGQTPPLRTVEEMAAHYLREIREVQPHGPYLLGGYCLGGTVAYEMAQRLAAAGEPVGLVALLDCYNFSRALKSTVAGFVLQKLRFHLGNFIRLRPGEMLDYVREKVRVARDGELANLLSSKPDPAQAGTGVARAIAGVEASVQAVNDRAAEEYRPVPYGGRLALFKPHINYKFYPDPKMGWGDLALDGLDIVELPVNPHAMLVEPFVRQLAEELKKRIHASEGGVGPQGPGTRPRRKEPAVAASVG